MEPQVRVVPKKAGGMMLFSGNQLAGLDGVDYFGEEQVQHRFRTVNVDDVQSRWEAPNVDSDPSTGTSLRNFLHARDFERIAEDVGLTYEGLTPADALTAAAPK